MKLSVVYHSKTGNTKEMAEAIVTGMERVAGVAAKAFPIDGVDEQITSTAAEIWPSGLSWTT